ncbi:hypothetical protein HZH68_005998 [Vespula germanica]|uniref:Uncharacterized protein n=1 Tax=Vespula germanica TaxID=30212 RepID=A0A834NCL9_VESGE|nr:hypothetical protein HZH68_005998 [Vespula germanica]
MDNEIYIVCIQFTGIVSYTLILKQYSSWFAIAYPIYVPHINQIIPLVQFIKTLFKYIHFDFKCRNSSTTFGRGFLQDVHIQIAQNKKLKEVLVEVEEVRGFIQLLVENISIVKDLHNNVLSHTSKGMFQLDNINIS